MTTDPEAGTRSAKPHVLVGVDGSPASLEALRWAARLAPALDADIEALMVWDYPTIFGWSAGLAPYWRPDDDARKALETALDEGFGSGRPTNLTADIAEGPAAAVLRDRSAAAVMLIVGSRGHGGFAGLLLGSVSTACAEHAHCPVLVTHGKNPQEARSVAVRDDSARQTVTTATS
jgi:nucleotide-binding universal stress UspA family protein